MSFASAAEDTRPDIHEPETERTAKAEEEVILPKKRVLLKHQKIARKRILSEKIAEAYRTYAEKKQMKDILKTSLAIRKKQEQEKKEIKYIIPELKALNMISSLVIRIPTDPLINLLRGIFRPFLVFKNFVRDLLKEEAEKGTEYLDIITLFEKIKGKTGQQAPILLGRCYETMFYYRNAPDGFYFNKFEEMPDCEEITDIDAGNFDMFYNYFKPKNYPMQLGGFFSNFMAIELPVDGFVLINNNIVFIENKLYVEDRHDEADEITKLNEVISFREHSFYYFVKLFNSLYKKRNKREVIKNIILSFFNIYRTQKSSPENMNKCLILCLLFLSFTVKLDDDVLGDLKGLFFSYDPKRDISTDGILSTNLTNKIIRISKKLNPSNSYYFVSTLRVSTFDETTLHFDIPDITEGDKIEILGKIMNLFANITLDNLDRHGELVRKYPLLKDKTINFKYMSRKGRKLFKSPERRTLEAIVADIKASIRAAPAAAAAAAAAAAPAEADDYDYSSSSSAAASASAAAGPRGRGKPKPTPKLSVIPKMKPTKNFKENKDYIAFFKEINKILKGYFKDYNKLTSKEKEDMDKFIKMYIYVFHDVYNAGWDLTTKTKGIYSQVFSYAINKNILTKYLIDEIISKETLKEDLIKQQMEQPAEELERDDRGRILKPCKPGYVRNPKTKRCIKETKETEESKKEELAFGITPPKEGQRRAKVLEALKANMVSYWGVKQIPKSEWKDHNITGAGRMVGGASFDPNKAQLQILRLIRNNTILAGAFDLDVEEVRRNMFITDEIVKRQKKPTRNLPCFDYILFHPSTPQALKIKIINMIKTYKNNTEMTAQFAKLTPKEKGYFRLLDLKTHVEGNPVPALSPDARAFTAATGIPIMSIVVEWFSGGATYTGNVDALWNRPRDFFKSIKLGIGEFDASHVESGQTVFEDRGTYTALADDVIDGEGLPLADVVYREAAPVEAEEGTVLERFLAATPASATPYSDAQSVRQSVAGTEMDDGETSTVAGELEDMTLSKAERAAIRKRNQAKIKAEAAREREKREKELTRKRALKEQAEALERRKNQVGLETELLDKKEIRKDFINSVMLFGAIPKSQAREKAEESFEELFDLYQKQGMNEQQNLQEIKKMIIKGTMEAMTDQEKTIFNVWRNHKIGDEYLKLSIFMNDLNEFMEEKGTRKEALKAYAIRLTEVIENDIKLIDEKAKQRDELFKKIQKGTVKMKKGDLGMLADETVRNALMRELKKAEAASPAARAAVIRLHPRTGKRIITMEEYRALPEARRAAHAANPDSMDFVLEDEEETMLGKGKNNWALHKVYVSKPISYDKAHEIAKKFIKGNKTFYKEYPNKFNFRNIPKQKFDTFRGKKLNDDITLIYGKLKKGNEHLKGGKKVKDDITKLSLIPLMKPKNNFKTFEEYQQFFKEINKIIPKLIGNYDGLKKSDIDKLDTYIKMYIYTVYDLNKKYQMKWTNTTKKVYGLVREYAINKKILNSKLVELEIPKEEIKETIQEIQEKGNVEFDNRGRLLAPCKPGFKRNPETKRCIRDLTTSTGKEEALAWGPTPPDKDEKRISQLEAINMNKVNYWGIKPISKSEWKRLGATGKGK